MSTRRRRHFTPQQKAAVVRRHLAGKEAVADLADELKVQPSLIHLWVKQVLDQAERAFDRPVGRPAQDAKDRQIATLQATVAQRDAKWVQKNEVLSELMQEHVQLKTELGEAWQTARCVA